MTPQLYSIAVFVTDIDRAIDFYQNTLGLPLNRRGSFGGEFLENEPHLGVHPAVHPEARKLVGRETGLTFTVSRGGAPVTGLQPYLGAFGHLVSLRAGDLAYLHTHPETEAHDGATGGPDVRFATTFPTAGAYRLFLDFQVDGVVRTAAFTVVVPSAAS